MEQIKGSLGSQTQQQQQNQLQQQNQSKKKSKNKKKNSKNESNTVTRSIEEQQQQQPEGVMMVENGLTDQMKQQLHIDGHSIKNTSTSSSSITTNDKVNGLMPQNPLKTKACPPATTTRDNQMQPPLNGHHHDHAEKEELLATNGNISPATAAVTKKSKRKPNNKKNPVSLENTSNKLENGHCLELPTQIAAAAAPASCGPKQQQLQNGIDHLNKVVDKTDIALTTQSTQKETNINTAMTNSTTITNNTPAVTPAVEISSENVTQEIAGEKINQNPSIELDLSNVHIEYKEYESELQMHVSFSFSRFTKITSLNVFFITRTLCV